jgi:hypothetical protein
MDITTCMYHTGLDPFTGQEVHVARHLKDRELKRAPSQFFKPQNHFEVRQAPLAAGRGDLINSGCDCPIRANPPKAPLQARMAKAERDLTEGRYVHTVEAGGRPRTARPGAGPVPGNRPQRKSTRRNKQRPR